MPQNKWILSRR